MSNSQVDKKEYNKAYYEKNKEKLRLYNKSNQQKKYENEEERKKILARNRNRYEEVNKIYKEYQKNSSISI